MGISIAMSAATAGLSYFEGQQAADDQAEALQQGAALMNEQTREQYRQVNAQASDEMSARALQARQERARLRVVAGESGIGGNLVDRALNQSLFNEGTDIATLENNRANTAAQLHEEAKGRTANAQSQMNSIKRPSLIGTGLQIGGAALNAYSTKKTNELLAQNKKVA